MSIDKTGRIAMLVLGLAAIGKPVLAQAVHVDPSWLHADAASSSVQLTLISGLGGVNGGMSFNGAVRGGLVFTVPVGWHVTIHYRNSDQTLPHSVVVIPAVMPVPTTASAPAFAHAASRQLAQGLPSEAHEDLTFIADRAGNFYIFCAVPGHGAAGMWIRMTVSATITGPTLAAAAKAGS